MEIDRRIVWLILVALMLFGCSDHEQELNDTKAQLAKTQQQLSEYKSGAEEQRYTIWYWDQRASWTAACDVGINFCPKSMSEPGREALRLGFSNSNPIYWAVITTKLLIAAATIGTLVGVFWLIHIRYGKPAQQEIEKATHTIEDAERRAQTITDQETALRVQVGRTRRELVALRSHLAEAKWALRSQRHALRRIEADVASSKAARDALSAWDSPTSPPGPA